MGLLRALFPCFYPKVREPEESAYDAKFEAYSVETNELYLSKLCVFLEVLRDYVGDIKRARDTHTISIEYLQRNQRLFRSQGCKKKQREIEKLFLMMDDMKELKDTLQQLVDSEPMPNRHEVIRCIAEVTKNKMIEMEVNFLPQMQALEVMPNDMSVENLLFASVGSITKNYSDEASAIKAMDAFTLYLALLKDIADNHDIFLNDMDDLVIVSFASFCGKISDMSTALKLNALTNTKKKIMLKALIEKGDDILFYYKESGGLFLVQDDYKTKASIISVNIDDGDAATVSSDDESISNMLDTNATSEKYNKIHRDSLRIASSLKSEKDVEHSSQVSLPTILRRSSANANKETAKKQKHVPFSEIDVNKSSRASDDEFPLKEASPLTKLSVSNAFTSLNDSTEIDRIL